MVIMEADRKLTERTTVGVDEGEMECTSEGELY